MLQPHLVSHCYKWCYYSGLITLLQPHLLLLCFNHTWCHSATSDVITLVTMLQPHLVSQCYQRCYPPCDNASTTPGVTVLPAMLLLLSQCFNHTWCHSATSDVITLVTMLQPHLVWQCYQRCYPPCDNASTTPGVTVLPAMLLLLSQCFNRTWCHSATSDVITLVTMLQPHLVSQCYQRCYYSCHNASTAPDVTVLPAMLLLLWQCFNHTWCHRATSDVITLVAILPPQLVSQCCQWCYHSCHTTSTAPGVTVQLLMLI